MQYVQQAEINENSRDHESTYQEIEAEDIDEMMTGNQQAEYEEQRSVYDEDDDRDNEHSVTIGDIAAGPRASRTELAQQLHNQASLSKIAASQRYSKVAAAEQVNTSAAQDLTSLLQSSPRVAARGPSRHNDSQTQLHTKMDSIKPLSARSRENSATKSVKSRQASAQ